MQNISSSHEVIVKAPKSERVERILQSLPEDKRAQLMSFALALDVRASDDEMLLIASMAYLESIAVSIPQRIQAESQEWTDQISQLIAVQRKVLEERMNEMDERGHHSLTSLLDRLTQFEQSFLENVKQSSVSIIADVTHKNTKQFDDHLKALHQEHARSLQSLRDTLSQSLEQKSDEVLTQQVSVLRRIAPEPVATPKIPVAWLWVSLAVGFVGALVGHLLLR